MEICDMPAVDSACGTSAALRAAGFFASGSTTPSILVGVTHPQTCLVLVERLRSFREAGFRVTLVSSPGEWLDCASAAAGVESIAVPIERQIAPISDLVSLLRLCRLLRRLKPDMVEFSTPKAGLLGSLAAALCRVPCRVYLLRGLKLETTGGFKRQLLCAAERLASHCAHRVLCTSKSLRARAATLRLVPEKKLHLLGAGSSQGVDVDRFSPGPSNVRRCFGLTSEHLVIGFVGRMTRDKGLPELILAFEIIARVEPDAHLLLVGWFDASEDSLDPALRKQIERDPRIHCTGFVADTVDCYRAMDVMVLPTWREGLPNSVLEAQSCGVPVITTYSTGSRDSVVPEVTGLLVPAGYPTAIIETVLKLARDPGRRSRMGRAARAWVQKHFAKKRVLDLTVDYYKTLLAQALPDAPTLHRGRKQRPLAQALLAAIHRFRARRDQELIH
jgi:glycosyltransferase involved in cell wall biosynthesis